MYNGLNLSLGNLSLLSKARTRSLSAENFTGEKGMGGMAEDGTDTEDYFCGSYNFDREGKYTEFTTPYAGLSQVIRPDGTYQSQQRFGLYRWHIMDPIRFERNLKVTIQALGWRSGGRYLPMRDDISSTAFWYQQEPHAPFPALPDRDGLEVI